LKKSVLAYVFSLAPFACFIFWKASLSLYQGDLSTLAILTLMFILLEVMAIRLPSGPVISLTSGLSMVALFCFGVEQAIISAAVPMVLIAIAKRWEYYRTIYNISLYIISIYTAGFAFSALNGVPGVMDIMKLWPNIGAVLVYFLVNSLLTARLFSLLQEKGIFQIWYRMVGDSFLVYVAVQILSLTSTYMYLNQGIVGVIMLVTFLFMLQMVFRSHYQLFEKEKERAVEFEAIFNTAQSGILMIDKQKKVKMVNKKFEQLFQIEQELKGKNLEELFGVLNQKLLNQEAFQELLGENKKVQNIEIILDNNEHKIIQASIAALDNEQELGKIVTLTDITSEWKKNKQLKELYNSAIRSLAAAVDTKDTYTSGHSNRVADLAVSIGRKIGLNENDLEILRYAGLLHDIGKIGIDDKILRKPGPLDSSEWIKMKEHPLKGVAILDEVHAFKELIPIIKYHHEKYDGTGYCEGLKGENIPLGSRIIAVADAFDAMTSNRSYRKALTVREAVQRLLEGKGTQFDPLLVDVFISLVEQGEIEYHKSAKEEKNTYDVQKEQGLAGLQTACSLEQTYQEVLYASMYDYLTDVYNRGYFIKLLQVEMEKAKILGYPLSLCITDLDHFKELNDYYGHLKGDTALRQFAFYLKEGLRESDLVGRYGGDEFTIIFPKTNYTNAVNIMNRLLDSINGKVFSAGNENLKIPTTSYGIATFPDECRTLEELFQLADERMYLYKNSRGITTGKLWTAK